MNVAFVKAALEWRIGEDYIEATGGLPRELLRKRVRERILIMDVWIIDSMQHQVHRRDAEHRGVKVETVEHVGLNVLAVRLEQVAGVDGLTVFSLEPPLRRRVCLQEVLHYADEKACSTTRRIA